MRVIRTEMYFEDEVHGLKSTSGSALTDESRIFSTSLRTSEARSGVHITIGTASTLARAHVAGVAGVTLKANGTGYLLLESHH